MPQTRFAVAAAFLVALALAMGGCAENRATFFIELVKVPEDDCTVESSEDGNGAEIGGTTCFWWALCRDRRLAAEALVWPGDVGAQDPPNLARLAVV